jgi:hypothetical protein
MKRRAVGLMAVLTLALAGWAQPQPGEPVSLTLHPAAPPKPSLKYRLLPDRRDQQPGNAAALYYRAVAMLVENQPLFKEIQSEYWDNWRSMPLKELPRPEVHDKLRMARHLLAEVEQAAQRRDCDWLLEGRSEGLGLVLPELSIFRRVACLLAVRARLEIADGQLDQTLKTMQTGYALAHRLGEKSSPTLMHAFLAVSVAAGLTEQLEELIQQPNSPNLYWSLTALPRPFFDPKSALLEGSTSLERMFPWLTRLEKGPMTLAEVQAGMVKLDQILDDFGLRKPERLEVTGRAALFVQALPVAKEALLAQGMKAEELEAMPTIQVVALHAYREYREAFEEGLKWMYTPEPLYEAGYQKALARCKKATERMDRLFFRGLLNALGDGDPLALERLFAVYGRMDRRLAALRCLEALRLQAAANGGQWPTALKDVTEVPVPVDPVTGKPFEYRRNGDRATLATPPAEGKTLPVKTLTFELTLER